VEAEEAALVRVRGTAATLTDARHNRTNNNHPSSGYTLQRGREEECGRRRQEQTSAEEEVAAGDEACGGEEEEGIGRECAGAGLLCVLALSAACLLLVGAMPTKPRDPFAEFHSKSPTRSLPGQLATTLAGEPTPRCAASLATTSAPHAAAGRSSIRPISRYCSLWRRWRKLMPVNCLLVWRWNHSSLWRAPPAGRRVPDTSTVTRRPESAPEHERASAPAVASEPAIFAPTNIRSDRVPRFK